MRNWMFISNITMIEYWNYRLMSSVSDSQLSDHKILLQNDTVTNYHQEYLLYWIECPNMHLNLMDRNSYCLNVIGFNIY